jgi:flagellar hook protein FlgE
MMRALFTGVSGMQVHQRRMDVVANNIANVNTVGFKASRMTFADALSQMMRAASGDNEETGRAGRNPMQVGLGVNIGSIDNLMMQGAAQRTDRGLDLTIQGEGFFIVSDERETLFTRAGNVDWNGHWLSINGMRLMGWGAIEDPDRPGTYRIQQGVVQPLTTGPEVLKINASPTSAIEFVSNLNIDDLDEDNSIIRTMRFYDSVGNFYTMDIRFTWHPPGVEGSPTTNASSAWTFDFVRGNAPDNEEIPAEFAHVTIYPNDNREAGRLVGIQINGPLNTPAELDLNTSKFIQFDTNGNIIRPTNELGNPIDLEFALNFIVPALDPPSVVGGNPSIVIPPAGFEAGMLTLSFGNATQQMSMGTTIAAWYLDGHAPGFLMDISIGSDGIITGRYSNDEIRILGQIPLAVFRNPEGLERVGNNFWRPTVNSGLFDGVGRIGDMIPGSLEMSNVDIGYEFVEMITTQRGFQSNTRVITTSDEILQEVINLKR